MPRNESSVNLSRKELESNNRRLCEINEELAQLNAKMIEEHRSLIRVANEARDAVFTLEAIGEGVKDGWALVAWAKERGQLARHVACGQGIN